MYLEIAIADLRAATGSGFGALKDAIRGRKPKRPVKASRSASAALFRSRILPTSCRNAIEYPLRACVRTKCTPLETGKVAQRRPSFTPSSTGANNRELKLFSMFFLSSEPVNSVHNKFVAVKNVRLFAGRSR
jgi:hypothetical protein